MTNGELVIGFIEKHCRVPEGMHTGKPIKLEVFQKKFIKEIYDNPMGTRRAILSIARKNGKTALIAGIVLAHVVGPMKKLNTQIVSGAMSRAQASLVFNLAVKMLELNPVFMGMYTHSNSGKHMTGLHANVEYRALSAEATTAHGLSPVLVIVDEMGQVKGPTSPFIDALTTSQGAHSSPLFITISTQAATDADCLSLWIDDAIRSGDPHTVCHLYESDKNCELLDKSQWGKANPALGKFRSEKDLEEQLKQASRIPSSEATARNLLLNQRISLDSLWLAPSIWKANNREPDIQLFQKSTSVSLALDLSMKNDLTAAVISVRDEQGLTSVMPFVFIPSDGLLDKEKRDRAPYSMWVRNGFLITVPGPVLDYDWVCEYLKKTLGEMKINVNTIAFDRWRIAEMKSAAVRQGFGQESTWVEVGQGYMSMSPRIEFFETLLLQNKIRHGNHPLMNMAVANAIVVRDPSGNRKIDKSKSTQRIDPLVAAVMSVGTFMTDGQTFDVSAMIV